MKKLLLYIIICLFLSHPAGAQYVKDSRYLIGGTDGLQNLRCTSYYPYPSDYRTAEAFEFKWSYKFEENFISYYTGDVNGDGILEVVCYHAKSISVLNNSGQLMRRIPLSGARCSVGFLEDFDKDGAMDIIAGYNQNRIGVISVFSFYKGEIARFETACTTNTNICPYGIINRKLIGTVYTGYDPPPRGYIAFDTISRNEIFLYEGGAIGGLISISDMNNDQRYLLSNYSGSPANGAVGDGVNHNGTMTHDSNAFVVVIDDDGNEKLTFDFTPYENPVGDLRTYFLDSRTGNEEKLLVLVNETHPSFNMNKHYIINVETGEIESVYEQDFPGSWSVVIADLNGDGIEEIIATCNHWNQYVFDQQFNVITKKTHRLNVLAANDINGDGETDIIGESGETIVVLDKRLDEQWSYALPIGVNRLRISDLDFNGRNEIIAGSDPNESNELFVIEAADNPDLPAPSDASSLTVQDGVFITWDYAQDVPVQRFNVYRHTEPWFKVNKSFLIGTVDGSNREYRDYSAPKKRNYYKITAVNEGGDESYASSAVVSTVIDVSWPETHRNLLLFVLSAIIAAVGLACVNIYFRNRRDQARKLIPIFDDAPVSTIVMTNAGVITHLNSAARELFCNFTDLRNGYNLLSIFKEQHLSDWSSAVEEFLTDTALEVRKELPLSGDEGTRSILVILRKITNGKHEQLIHIAAIDISNHLTTKTALAWTSMAHALAHEIKNPLTSIQLALQSLNMHYLSQDSKISADAHRYVDSIDEDIERIRKETNRLMQFSRSSRLKKSAVMISATLKDVIDHYGIMSNNNIDLTFDADEDLAVYGNKDMLELAFRNIIENSLDAIQGKGKIIIRANAEEFLSEETTSIDKRVIVEIADSGCGIPRENLHRIFDPKFTTKEMGAGFGLSIVRHIINDHKGTIEINSKNDIGTSIFISLPQFTG